MEWEVRPTIVWIVLSVGVITYLFRALPMFGLASFGISAKAAIWLQFVAPAVLAGLIVNSLITSSSFHLSIPAVAALVPTIAFARFTGSLPITTIAGVISYWLIDKFLV